MRTMIAVGAATLGLALTAGAQTPKSAHVLTAPASITWGAAPPVFEKGAMFAVMSGDPGKAGPFTVRLKLPAGFKIAPHWHPTDENVTVISGSLGLGMGDTLDPKAVKVLPAGGYAVMPAEMHHYAIAQAPTVVQVHGTGPFALNYVNPADDPTKRATPAK